MMLNWNHLTDLTGEKKCSRPYLLLLASFSFLFSFSLLLKVKISTLLFIRFKFYQHMLWASVYGKCTKYSCHFFRPSYEEGSLFPVGDNKTLKTLS